MPDRISAGLLMFRHTGERLEVFLAHPGGPFFARKDRGHWTIPKGEIRPGEELLETARREFEEETGLLPVAAEFLPLGSIRQKGGKLVHAWGFRGDWPADRTLRSGTFCMEWPPGSGKYGDYPEVDRVGFFSLDEARLLIKPTQWPLVERLESLLRTRHAPAKPLEA